VKKFLLIPFALIAIVLYTQFFPEAIKNFSDEKFEQFIADPTQGNIKFFLKDDKRNYFKNFSSLNGWLKLKKQQLIFATNGGMFMTNFQPLGLYIENRKKIVPLNNKSGTTNFYIKPNGIFLIDIENTAHIIPTEKFRQSSKIKYATQSGPMLVIEGKINSQFKEGSLNLNIRSGVGILSNGKVLFAISKIPVSFYDFAEYFKRNNCSNALFLDGGISEFYYPGKGITENINSFGIIIGVVK